MIGGAAGRAGAAAIGGAVSGASTASSMSTGGGMAGAAAKVGGMVMGGIEIMLNDSGDAAIYRWFGKMAQRWQEIKYTLTGRPYITVASRRYHLDEFMKVR